MINRFLVIPVLLATLVAGSACIPEPERMTAACGIAIDGSGSGDDKKGFDAGGEIKRSIVPFLVQNKCRRVAYAPIAMASEAHFCTKPSEDIDPDVSGNVDRKKLQNRYREQTRDRVSELLDCIRKDPRSKRGSDVLGGLKVLQKNRPQGEGNYHMLVISDFVTAGPEGWMGRIDLSTPARRTSLMDVFARDKRIPDLTGTEVLTAGYGKLFSDNPERMAGFDSFWNDLLKQRGKCASLGPFTSA